MSVLLVHDVKSYVEQIGPHLAHGTERADDIPKRLLGVRCPTHDFAVQIPIAEFKATGDLEAYQAGIEPFMPKEEKK